MVFRQSISPSFFSCVAGCILCQSTPSLSGYLGGIWDVYSDGLLTVLFIQDMTVPPHTRGRRVPVTRGDPEALRVAAAAGPGRDDVS